MQSPKLEWTLWAGHIALLDILRAKGEADSDTISEVVRDLVERHPAGRVVFTAGYAVGAIALYRHICKPT